jgi:NRAMP (natural resistance-associated macrophage protein)-like metal ion transporter
MLKMAKEPDQEGPEEQQAATNEIEPGMEVEDTDNLLGGSDLVKPRVEKVIRNKQGKVEDIVVDKGLLFKKEIEVPADLIEKVEERPEHGKGSGEVVIETTPQDEEILARRGLRTLLPGKEAGLQQQGAGSTVQGKQARKGQAESEAQQSAKPPHHTGMAEEAETAQVAAETQPGNHRTHARVVQLLHEIGPGFLMGMSGNDATAVTNYAIDGARVGYGHLWLMLLTTPMYQAVEYACSKIGRTTKMGLDDILRAHYSRPVAIFASLVLIVANIGLIAGNLVAIGAGLQLITGINWVWFEIPVAIALWYITVFSNFNLIKKIFIIMSAAFITYIVTAFFSGADWKAVLINSFVPHVNFSFADISAALALLGATISPYSMYWQMSAEVEEKRTGTMKQQFREASVDVASGTIGGNLVSYFIIITTASTLFVHHESIQTAADAANALGPLVGPFAKYLFAIGLIGAGLIAIPVLAASTADGVAGTFGWPAGLADKPWQAEGFYLVLSFSLLISLALALLRIDPIRLIFYSNVLVAVLAPIIVIYLMVIGNTRKIMGGHKLGWLTNFFMGVTALVLIAGSVLFFYGLFTGQGGT